MLFVSSNLQLLSLKYKSENYLILNYGLLTCKQCFLMITKLPSQAHHFMAVS